MSASRQRFIATEKRVYEDSAFFNERSTLISSIDDRSLNRRKLFGLVRCLPNGNGRVGGNSPKIVASPEELAPTLSPEARCTLAIVRSDRVQKWQAAVLWLTLLLYLQARICQLFR